MNAKHYTALAIAILALALGAYYSELRFLSYSHSPAPTLVTSLATQGDTLPAATGTAQAGTRAGGPSQGVTVAAQNATLTKPAETNFTLKAATQNYHGTVGAGATILDAMKTLEVGGSFQFTSKDFPGMGAFVESINGKAGADGFYWILYVNGTASQTGASQTHLKAGDSIEWRYEKSY